MDRDAGNTAARGVRLQAEAHEHESISAASIWAGLSLIALATVVMHAAAPINHDVAWFLEGAGRLLEGGRFGRDFVDPNPPMVLWLGAIPVALARWAGIGVAGPAAVLPAVIVLASVLLTDAVLARGSLPERSRRELMFFAGAFLLIAPGYDYGQREHLMLAAALPYVAAASVRAEDRPLSWRLAAGAALFSAFGFCLKPYFVAIPCVVELWLMVKTRSLRRGLRAETLVLAVTIVGYAAALVAFWPDYVFGVLPDAATGYWALNSSFATVAFNLAVTTVPPLIAAVILARGGARNMIPAMAQAMWAAGVGAFVVALLQMKGWSYQLLPGVGFAFIGCATIFVVLDKAERRRPLAAAAIALLLVTGFAPSARDAWQLMRGDDTVDRVGRLSSVFRAYAGKAGPVFAFITSPRDIHPAVLASGTRWIGSTCCVYLLPSALRADELDADHAARARGAAQRQLADAIARIAAERPAVIAIDANREKLGFGDAPFDYLAYLLQDARFATLWQAYAERPAIDGFRIFVRAP